MFTQYFILTKSSLHDWKVIGQAKERLTLWSHQTHVCFHKINTDTIFAGKY